MWSSPASCRLSRGGLISTPIVLHRRLLVHPGQRAEERSSDNVFALTRFLRRTGTHFAGKRYQGRLTHETMAHETMAFGARHAAQPVGIRTAAAGDSIRCGP